MKYHIEKNTIQETLVIPLYARALCTRRFPQLFSDPLSVELLERLDYDFSALEQTSGGLMQTFGAMEAAMRQSDLAWEVRDYLRDHPRAAVVNLGCGLDQTGRSCDNGQCRLYNIDLPDVMAVREALLPRRGTGEEPCRRFKRPLMVRRHRHTSRRRSSVLCRRGVLLLPNRTGASPLRGYGPAISGRAAGIRRRRADSRKTDAENLGQAGGHPGCGGVLLRPGCGKRIARLVGSHLCIQPRLYAGLPGAAGAGNTPHPPPSGRNCRRAAEAADRADGVSEQRRR